jgi:hypothetical protein
MKITGRKSKLIISFLIVSVLTVMLLLITSCQDLGLSGDNTEETTATGSTGDTIITSVNEAKTAVYQHLLAQAESYDAKIYLADFYTYCTNWNVQSEYFKDGSDIWFVEVDMTGESNWDHNPYWQHAAWFVYRDGEVIPSNLFQVNALRIEADLQSLSTSPATE